MTQQKIKNGETGGATGVPRGGAGSPQPWSFLVGPALWKQSDPSAHSPLLSIPMTQRVLLVQDMLTSRCLGKCSL